MKQVNDRTEWSNPIARILFDRDRTMITVRSQRELASLINQAKANKATARILTMIDGADAATRSMIESVRTEVNQRLRDALSLLIQTQEICVSEGIPFAVIKSLDAMPDIGHDIDLLVGRKLGLVRSMLLARFQCSPVTLTFCDRQAGKFSTFIRGFESDFELYTRVSQLGEEYYPEDTIINRRMKHSLPQGDTYLCSPEDTLLIACIHTMYRHQKIRLSDLKVAWVALNSDLDLNYVLQVVSSAGIEQGFAAFITILTRMCKSILEGEPLPSKVQSYTSRILSSDSLLSRILRDLQMTFPLKIPLRLAVLLFLYKAATDLVHARFDSSVRSALAPALLVLDKLIPFKLQKAASIRIW
jgi:hypothetical protein